MTINSNVGPICSITYSDLKTALLEVMEHSPYFQHQDVEPYGEYLSIMVWRKLHSLVKEDSYDFRQ